MDTPIWREGWTVGYDPDLDLGYIRNDDAGIDVTLQFQHGPVQDAGGINGIQNEELVALLIMRLKDEARRKLEAFVKSHMPEDPQEEQIS